VTASSEFSGLLEEYYPAWFRFHPTAAVEVGIEGYADQLAPYDDDDIGALVGLNEMLLAGLDTIDYAQLDADQQIDYRLAYGAALLENLELREADWRHHNPVRFIPVDAIHQLFLRPVGDFEQAIEARLAQFPEYLRRARMYINETSELIPALWLEAAVLEARSGAAYIRDLERHPLLAALRDRHTLIEVAAQALDEYAQFLDQDIRPMAQGSFACGRKHFDRLLRYRHFLDIDADQLYAFGERLFEETQQSMRAICRELTGNEDTQALLEQIQSRHPAAEDLLDRYRERMRASRDFLEQHRIVPLPEKQKLKVIETPVYLRHQIPFAAYMEPTPNDPEQRGYYYVTPVEDDSLLVEHNDLSIAHTCVHEAWPGHHLQFVTANSSEPSRSLPRLLNPSATLYEGWALYCEELMVEQGFLDQPESRFLLLRDRLWRALRIQIDVALHCRDMSIDEAADLMQEALGFPRQQALADLTWYSFAPTVPMGYATGWALLRSVCSEFEEQNPDFSLYDFHRDLLTPGSVALPLVLGAAFGDEAWKTGRERIFESGELPR
jgi:uncharacterized protein (DUF885 family)